MSCARPWRSYRPRQVGAVRSETRQHSTGEALADVMGRGIGRGPPIAPSGLGLGNTSHPRTHCCQMERARASHVLTSSHRASRPRRQARHTMCTAWRPRVCRPLFHLLPPSHRTTPRFAHLCHHHPRTILANASALSQPSLRKRLNLSRRGREPSATAGGERRLRTGRTCRRSG